jgi:hypothetical protein
MFILAITVASSGWYLAASLGSGTWPGGSSLPGFTFGVSGGLIIIFECLLWARKQVRVWRIGQAQTWMRAHIWLGLLSVPLLVFHSGFVLGGTLSRVLLLLFLLVIFSGLWGLALQQFLPRRMLDDVPAETIYSQIGHIVAQFSKEADRLVLATCGPSEDGDISSTGDGSSEGNDAESHLTIGAVRAAGWVSGKVLVTRVPPAPVPGSEPLRMVFRSTIAPYLRAGSGSLSPLRYANRASALFDDLKTRLDPAAHGSVDTLASLCDQRRQLDLEARLHLWLYGWLWVHLPMSAALLALMFVHVYYALKYS